MEFFTVHGVVLSVLNNHRVWSDPLEIEKRAGLLDEFAECVKDKSEADAEMWRQMAQATRVQKKSDLQVARRRYNLSCEVVAKPLLQLQ